MSNYQISKLVFKITLIFQVNAKKFEIGFPKCPLTVSFIGDYGEETNNSFNQTSESKSSLFSAYKSKNENTTTTPTASQVI